MRHQAKADVRAAAHGSRPPKTSAVGALLAVLAVGATSLAGQIPERPTNLRVLPTDLSRDSLVEIMRGFSFALGVRCQYCHTGGDGISFEGVDFADDSDPDKIKARAMLRMVGNLNDVVLAALPERDDPPVSVWCKTCHRGRPRPISLADALLSTLDELGPDSTVALYNRLRDDERVVLAGSFDFGEWETNVLGERLRRASRLTDAIAIYTLNGSRYPESIGIELALGALYEQTGDPESAISHYERVLELNPDNARARDRLAELRGG